MVTDFEMQSKEERVVYICNHLIRSNEAFNSEIEELVKFSNEGVFTGSYEENDHILRHICNTCKTLLETQRLLIEMLEPTVRIINLQMSLKLLENIE